MLNDIFPETPPPCQVEIVLCIPFAEAFHEALTGFVYLQALLSAPNLEFTRCAVFLFCHICNSVTVGMIVFTHEIIPGSTSVGIY